MYHLDINITDTSRRYQLNLIMTELNSITKSKLKCKLVKLQHLVLSGGGLLGISYIGLFRYLEERKVTHQIKSITACSAGAIFATLFCLGYTSQDMDKLIKSLNFKDYININAESIIKFPRTKGLETGIKMIEFLKQMIKDKTGDDTITFKQAYDKYNIVLQIGVTNLTTMNFEIFNYITKPDLPIYIAIRASIAIPIMFEPVIFDGAVYCDGGVVDNLPVDSAIAIAELMFIEENNATKSAVTTATTTAPTTAQTTAQTTAPTETEADAKVTAIKTDTQSCLDSILSVFLMSKYQPINSDNIATVTLPHYVDVIMQAINNGHIIYNFRHKYVDTTLVIEIPVDIMTFIKINASVEDINNIIDIAYNTTCDMLE